MRKLIGLMMVMLSMVSSVYATQSRLEGLGLLNWMIEDDNLIWLNPARITDYKNMVWAELGTAIPGRNALEINRTSLNDEWGGISYGFELVGVPSVAAAFVARPYRGLVDEVGKTIGGEIFLPGLIRPLQPKNKFDFVYGIALADNLKLAARINIADNYDKSDYSHRVLQSRITEKNNRESKEINMAMGGLLSNIGPISKLDAALNINMPSVKNTFVETIDNRERESHELKTDGAINLGVTGRAIFPILDASKLIGYFGYGSIDLSNTYIGKEDRNVDGDYDDPYEYYVKQKRTQKCSGICFGGSLNSQINDKTLMVFALSGNYIKIKTSGVQSNRAGITTQEYKEEISTMKIPVNIGLERKLSKLLTGRCGVSYNILSTRKIKITDPDDFDAAGKPREERKFTEEVDLSDKQATVSVGLGVNITKSLTLDAVIRQEVVFSGTYIISGVPETFISMLTATYKF